MTIDTARLRALADAATPGPWEAAGNEVSQHWSRPEPWKTVASSEVACMSYCYGGSGRGIENEADAAYIAAIDPPTLIALLDELKRLRAERNLLFRDGDGRIWETLPNGLLKLTEWDITTARTPREVEEDYGPVTPWEPVEGDGDA